MPGAPRRAWLLGAVLLAGCVLASGCAAYLTGLLLARYTPYPHIEWGALAACALAVLAVKCWLRWRR
jgi:hypothetical protein